jgi:ribosomal protein L32
MTGLFCPTCGKQHLSNDRYCEYCGNDLEEHILRYKSQQMPIKYNNGKKPVAISKDDWDNHSRTEQVPHGTEPTYYGDVDRASDAAACFCCAWCAAEALAEIICGMLDCC